MVNNANDIGFIQDISGLDKLRQQAVHGDKSHEKQALKAAAHQFESIFTSMLLKSMRKANSNFKSDLFNDKDQQVYRQMLDEQMASDLSSSGSLGLADMIVKQLSVNLPDDAKDAHGAPHVANHTNFQRPATSVTAEPALAASGEIQPPQSQPASFDSPQSFIHTMRPYAEKAAKMLGVEPSLLLAQAALETGWGKKVVKNAHESSNNLFNIKADPRWNGDKVTTQTLEFEDGTPVKQVAAFRAYPSYQDSFNDYVRFLNDNPRYQSALKSNQNSENFIRGIHSAGYATDPNYADKVLKVQQRIKSM